VPRMRPVLPPVIACRPGMAPLPHSLGASQLAPYLLYGVPPRDGPPEDSSEATRQRQRRTANLGTTIELLKELVPHIATQLLPKLLLSPQVLLRVCPSHFEEYNAYLPAIKGVVPYYASCKLLQFILTSIVLTPQVQIHIQSIRTSVNDKIHPYYSVHPDSTKIMMRWTTSSERASDICGEKAAPGWSRVATNKFFNLSEDDLKIDKPAGLGSTLALLSNKFKRVTNESLGLERVVSGIFIFELNEDNDRIIVHTVEDVDILERTETEAVGALRVC
jgi:uncharacterized protein Veg